MAEKSKHGQDTPPNVFPQTTPRYGTQGHDFTLQAVIEMQRSLGELTAKVDRLIGDVKGHGEKIEGVRLKLAWVAGGAAVVGFLVAFGLAVLKLLPISSPISN